MSESIELARGSYGGSGSLPQTGGGQSRSLALRTAASVRDRAADITARLCGTGPKGMRAAEQTTLHFFESPARARLLQWLGQPGACAPVLAAPAP